jgi:hypothetical protein
MGGQAMESRLPRESDLRSLECALADLIARRDSNAAPGESDRLALDTMIRGLEAEIAARQRGARPAP